MRFSPLKKNEKECFLALDIGTEAVKALVFEKSFDAAQDREKYAILGSALQYFDESKPFENDRVVFNVKEEAIKMSGKNPQGLLLNLPPDVLRSRIHSQSINRQNAKGVIDKKEEENIRQLILKETEKSIAEYFTKHSGIMSRDIRFVDNKILEIKIDGYEVPALAGYSGRNLDFRVISSFLPLGYFENFSRVSEGFKLESSKIVNPINNLASILGLAEGIFVDIGGEITQICLVRNNKIEMIDEFNIGGKDFSRVLSQTLGMRTLEARFLKERYSRGDLTEETRQRIKDIISSAVKEWKGGLKSKLKIVKGLLPSTFFLFGGGSQLPEVEELISEEEKETRFIYPKDFSAFGGSALGGKNILINNPQYTNLILLCYAR